MWIVKRLNQMQKHDYCSHCSVSWYYLLIDDEIHGPRNKMKIITNLSLTRYPWYFSFYLPSLPNLFYHNAATVQKGSSVIHSRAALNGAPWVAREGGEWPSALAPGEWGFLANSILLHNWTFPGKEPTATAVLIPVDTFMYADAYWAP